MFTKKHHVLIVASLLIALLPYLYIGLFNHPIADDFTYAFKGKTQSLLPTLLNEYLNWNGRYISNVFVLLNPIAFDSFIAYKLTPAIIIILTIISFQFFFKSLLNGAFKTKWLFALSLIATLLFLYQMPIISEGIYWYTGAVTYHLGNIFLLFYLGTLILFFNKKYLFQSRFVHFALLILLLFISMGFNEIIMLVLVGFSVGVFSFSLLKKHNFETWILLLAIFSIVFGLIVYLSPGNESRESHFSQNHQLAHSFLMSIAQTFRFFFEWISSAPLILLSLLYYKLNKKLSSEIPLFKSSFYINPYLSIFLLFFAIFIGAFPAYWSTGILGQHRTMNVSYFLFIILWFINLTVIFNRNLLHIDIKSKTIQTILLLVVVGSFVFAKNGYVLIDDLRSGDYLQFNEQMNNRFKLMESTRDTIYFDPIENPPETLFVMDITSNPNNWQNKGYSIFFESNKPIKLSSEK